MTDLSAETKALANYRPTNKVRFVTAASLFDGHDAAINIMRRILQGMGAEVIHLGHNRSVDEVVTAALQEDVQGIAISSYQGGHVEYFKYMVDLLKSRGGEHIQVFGGGGGVIVPAEIRELQGYGVTRIYSPEDGQRMGLAGMIGEMVMRCDADLSSYAPQAVAALQGHSDAAWRALAQAITALENGKIDADFKAALTEAAKTSTTPVLGITGTGGAGKSSLTDELIRRLRLDQGDALRIAVISIDPSRRKSGGALLGDRIRMNAIAPWQNGPRVFMRSLATRDFGSEISQALPDVLAACKAAGFDLIVVETSGIGQGDAAIVPLVDVSLADREHVSRTVDALDAQARLERGYQKAAVPGGQLQPDSLVASDDRLVHDIVREHSPGRHPRVIGDRGLSRIRAISRKGVDETFSSSHRREV